jgi:hypothetical protein
MSVSTTLAPDIRPDVRPAPGDPGWEVAEIERVTARLVAELAGRVEAARVQREVETTAEELSDATVRRFVPLLIERRVRRSLRDSVPMPSGTARSTGRRPGV